MSALSAPAALQLENELLLELRLDGEKLGLDILGYQRGDQFLLSLDELTNGLGFPITVDAVQGSAIGWYISEDRDFTLDIERAEVISDGKNWPIAEGEVVLFEGGLYVETKALEKWFPLHLSAVVRELYLDVEPTQLLPVQERMNRRDRLTTHATNYHEPKYPLQHTPYQLISPHITSLRMGYSTVRETPNSDAEYAGNYASLSRGDFAWMTSTLSLAGKSDEAVTNARLKLERTAFDGPMGLNHFEMGDISTGGFRGFLMRGDGGRVQSGGLNYESVSLEGSQLPGWDVELYQNNQLIMIQSVEQDGRYLFDDVPLLFGENRFELKFFGPNGEIDSREEFYFLGEDALKPGRITYELSAVQSGRTVFGVNDIGGDGDQDSGIYASEFSVGVSRHLTAGAGFRSIQVDGERLQSSNAGIGLATSRFYASARYFNTPNAQNSISTSLRTQLGYTNLSLGFTRFFEAPELVSSPQKWQSNLDIASSVFNIPVKIEFNTQKQESSTLYNSTIGTTIPVPGSGRFSSSIWFSSLEEFANGSTSSTSVSGGQSSFHTVLRPWNFRLSANYSFEPESKFQSFSATSNLYVDNDLSLDLSVRQNPTTDTTYYGGGISWKLDQVTINASVNYDSDERWGGLITMGTALVHQPGTLLPRLDSRASVNSGSVEVRVFEDASDTERERHGGVTVNGVQAWRSATTDENGIAYLSRMPAHRQVDITLDESTLAEYELRSKNPGVSVIARPGSFSVVEFPLVRTAELEGHVEIGVDDNKRPVSRALVSLKTPEGDVVAQTRTAFDGFYLFEGVEIGVYQVSLDESFAERMLDRPGTVKVIGNSGVVKGLDFSLREAQAESMLLDRVVKEDVSQQLPATEASTPVPAILASALPELESQVKPSVEEGAWYVQVGAYGSRELAQTAWERINKKMQALQGKIPRFAQYQNMIRLLVGPGLSKDAANQLCQQLKEDRLDCIVRNAK